MYPQGRFHEQFDGFISLVMVCIYFFFQEIEFPAITVCNLNKLEASSMYDLVNSVQNSSLSGPEKWGVLQREYYDGHDRDRP